MSLPEGTSMTGDRTDAETKRRALIAGAVDTPPDPPISSTIAVDVAAVSMCGEHQLNNTDHYLAIRLGRTQETLVSSLADGDLPGRFDESAYVMLVADGLDGHGVGARASRLALSTLAHLAIRYGKWNVRVSGENASEIVEQGEFLYRQVSDAMIEAGRTDLALAHMATSLTAVYIAGADLFFAHAGHSRAFLFRNGVLIQLTLEHSLERLISASAALRRVRLEARRPRAVDPSAQEPPHHAGDASGTTASGQNITIEHVQLWPGDRVLLCTNGLTDVLREEQIADVLAGQRRPAEECQRLVDLAREAGTTDSVTALLADYRIRTPHAPARVFDL
jgi:protein phosphatase